jgi:hypothetical protein
LNTLSSWFSLRLIVILPAPFRIKKNRIKVFHCESSPGTLSARMRVRKIGVTLKTECKPCDTRTTAVTMCARLSDAMAILRLLLFLGSVARVLSTDCSYDFKVYVYPLPATIPSVVTFPSSHCASPDTCISSEICTRGKKESFISCLCWMYIC